MRVAALHPDPNLVQLDCLAPDATSITLVVSTHRTRVACPDCGHPAERLHSRYSRTVADLPWNGVQVRLRLCSRKFFCDQLACDRRIFTERLPGLVDRYARRTRRLTELHRLLGYALSGEAGARMGAALGVARSPDALLQQVRQGRPVAEGGPRVLGVDDFAFRKGVHYGTILVDLERRCPVDLLSDRKAETLEQWLQAHPGAEVVAWDRAASYAEGIRQGAPAAVQVADRWHLLKNLTEALEALLTREHRALQAAATLPEPVPQAAEDAASTPEEQPLPEVAPGERRGRSRRELQDPLVRRERRLARYEAAMEQFRQGKGVREIARHLQMSRTTVAKYLTAGSFPERKVRVSLPTQVTPYAPYLERRWQEGCHNSVQLWREIQALGFAGGKTAVYRFTAAWRELRPPTSHPSIPPFPAPRTVLWWLVGDPERLTAEQLAFTTRLMEGNAAVRTAVELACGFFELVRQRQGERLPEWVRQAEQSEIAELATFARGVRQDWAAVLAGVTLPWSNGPVEGQITRLKLIKRQMYGRAGFDLLRARVLPLQTAA